jgi:SAM-dependent methyltransferase
MEKSTEPNPYETDNLLQMYLSLNFHLSSQSSSEPVPPMMPHENAPSHALHFPQRMARLLTSLTEGNCAKKRVLDIGCAVGGSAFELSKTFQHVEAFDFRWGVDFMFVCSVEPCMDFDSATHLSSLVNYSSKQQRRCKENARSHLT